MRLKKSCMGGFLLCALAGLLLAGCSSSSDNNRGSSVINLNTVKGAVSSPIFSDPITKNADGTLTTPSSTDIMWVDPTGGHNRVYSTDRGATNAANLTTLTGRVWVIDGQTDSVLFAITGFFGKHPATTIGAFNQSGPNGVMVANSASGAKELWAGDGDSKVRWVDLKVAGTPTVPAINDITGGAISTGGVGRADELAYDPDDDLILVGNDSEPVPFLTFIDRGGRAVATVKGAVAGNPDAKIFLDGVDANGLGVKATLGVEQPLYDKPFFYVAVPATKFLADGKTYDPASGAVIQVDPKTMSITKSWLVNTTAVPNCEPHGLALGPSHNVMIACGSKSTMVVKVINDQTGAIVADVTQIGGTDMAWFNLGDMKYYVGGGSFKTGGVVVPSIGVINALTNTWERNIPTGSIKDGKSVVVNPENNHIYLPVSDVGPGGIEVFF